MSQEILSIHDIKERLPYRYPMLLLDRVCINSETHCTALKNVSFNEQMFHGHFPGHPIMPGVLQVEAMQQVGEIAVQNKLDPSRENDIYIKKLKKVKFRRPNNPGDRMLVDVNVKEITDGEAIIAATTKNKGGVTAQAEITLAVRPRSAPPQTSLDFNEYDKDDDIEMDVVQIMSIIPHRYPFLLVDYIKRVEGTKVIAVKNTTYNEPVFRGYSDDYAVLPGAIQSEIVAQAGCVTQLSKPENKGKIAYFMSIQEAEFFHPIHPGDQLVCEVELPTSQSKFGRGEGFIKVDERIVSKTVMTFAIVDA